MHPGDAILQDVPRSTYPLLAQPLQSVVASIMSRGDVFEIEAGRRRDAPEGPSHRGGEQAARRAALRHDHQGGTLLADGRNRAEHAAVLATESLEQEETGEGESRQPDSGRREEGRTANVSTFAVTVTPKPHHWSSSGPGTRTGATRRSASTECGRPSRRGIRTSWRSPQATGLLEAPKGGGGLLLLPAYEPTVGAESYGSPVREDQGFSTIRARAGPRNGW